jgi:hypothetical protein
MSTWNHHTRLATLSVVYVSSPVGRSVRVPFYSYSHKSKNLFICYARRSELLVVIMKHNVTQGKKYNEVSLKMCCERTVL